MDKNEMIHMMGQTKANLLQTMQGEELNLEVSLMIVVPVYLDSFSLGRADIKITLSARPVRS